MARVARSAHGLGLSLVVVVEGGGWSGFTNKKAGVFKRLSEWWKAEESRAEQSGAEVSPCRRLMNVSISLYVCRNYYYLLNTRLF